VVGVERHLSMNAARALLGAQRVSDGASWSLTPGEQHGVDLDRTEAAAAAASTPR